MPGDGVVTIATRVAHGDIPGAADTVLLDVSDTGTGMEPEALARAFEPFFTTKPVGEGTGLGLATVFGIVRQSGGRITLASQPGVGTTVSIVLPTIEHVAPTLSTPHLAPVGGSEHILLVEDEPALRVATARLLSEHGYTVMAARDGLEALHLFDRLDHPIDLVVTDVAMPRLRGDQLAQQLIDRQPDLRFLFMSGYDSSEAGLPGRLLEKPVDEALLIRTIREVLDA
jgi:CheY-like chemotaxis protein